MSGRAGDGQAGPTMRPSAGADGHSTGSVDETVVDATGQENATVAPGDGGCGADDGGSDGDTIDLAALSVRSTSTPGRGGTVSASGGEVGADTPIDIETITGGAGNDNVEADELGASVLTCGVADDTFVFFAIGAVDGDRLTDFAAGDMVDLRHIDAAAYLDSDPDSQFTDGPAFSATGDVIFREEQRGDQSKYAALDGDVEGNTQADVSPELDGNQQVAKDDFLGIR